LGNGFIKKEGLNVIQTVNHVKSKVLKENEKIFLLSPYQGLYDVLNQATLVPDAAIPAASDGKTQYEDRKILDENPPMLIQWNSYLSLKNYYLYIWVIEKGYIPYTENGVNFFVDAKRYEEVFGNPEIVRNKMIDEYDTSYFTSKDIQGIANSWGKSMITLNKIFNEYKKFDVKNLKVQTNSLSKADSVEKQIPKYVIEKNDNSSSISINLDDKVYGQDADFLYLDLGIDKVNYNKGKVNIYWETDKNSFDDRRCFICDIGDGKLLIPLGLHPGWTFSNDTKIRISFNGCEKGTTFSINEMRLLKLNQNWMLKSGE
jgi:hypothetical protein